MNRIIIVFGPDGAGKSTFVYNEEQKGSLGVYGGRKGNCHTFIYSLLNGAYNKCHGRRYVKFLLMFFLILFEPFEYKYRLRFWIANAKERSLVVDRSCIDRLSLIYDESTSVLIRTIVRLSKWRYLKLFREGNVNFMLVLADPELLLVRRGNHYKTIYKAESVYKSYLILYDYLKSSGLDVSMAPID